MSQELVPSGALRERELSFLVDAARYLENPSFLMRVADLLGKPVDLVGRMLPEPVREGAGAVVNKALGAALRMAIFTLPKAPDAVALEELELEIKSSSLKHNFAAGVTGAVGGTFGLPALAVELPITTTIMLRNIASVASSLGEDLSERESRLNCLAVFSLGSNGSGAAGELKAIESSYYATRVALSTVTREAGLYVAKVTAEQLAKDLTMGASPVLVRYLSVLAQRLNIVVSQKLLAQALPVVGAAGGALVNVAFNAHFDRVAQYHFGIRALERRHGRDKIQAEYTAALQRIGGRTTMDDAKTTVGGTDKPV